MDDATSVLMTPKGSQRIDRIDLDRILAPAATDTFKPVKHSDLIDALHTELTARSLVVRREQYAVQHQGAMLFGTLDLAAGEGGVVAPSIGLRTANNRQMALQIAVGMRVLVCDNLCFAGDLIALRRKHTSRLNLANEMLRAMDRYEERFPRLTAGVERLKNTWMSADGIKRRIYEVFVQQVLPVRFFIPVVHSYAVEAERYGTNLWALHNAVSGHIKALPPGPAFRATVQLGRVLGLN